MVKVALVFFLTGNPKEVDGVGDADVCTEDHRLLALLLQLNHMVDVNKGIVRLLVVLEHPGAGVAPDDPVLGGRGEAGQDLQQLLLGGRFVPDSLENGLMNFTVTLVLKSLKPPDLLSSSGNQALWDYIALPQGKPGRKLQCFDVETDQNGRNPTSKLLQDSSFKLDEGKETVREYSNGIGVKCQDGPPQAWQS